MLKCMLIGTQTEHDASVAIRLVRLLGRYCPPPFETTPHGHQVGYHRSVSGRQLGTHQAPRTMGSLACEMRKSIVLRTTPTTGIVHNICRPSPRYWNNFFEASFLFLLSPFPTLVKSESQPASNSNSKPKYHQHHVSPTRQPEMAPHEVPMRALRRLFRTIDPPQAQRRGVRPLRAHARPQRPSKRSPRIPPRHPACKESADENRKVYRRAMARRQRLATANPKLPDVPVLLRGQERAGHLA